MLSILLCSSLLVPVETENPLSIHPTENPRQVKVTVALSGATAKAVPRGKLSQEQGEQWLQFRIMDSADKSLGPPIFGNYERKDNLLMFQPRYPLAYRKTYKAEFSPTKGKAIAKSYTVPPPPQARAPEVTKVYPGAKVLPANNLKFYIHFSKPMRGGKDVFENIYLLDSGGKRLYSTWLEDELWDADNERLLLYIHPGRIKWGLLLRKMLGPVLYPDQSYTLVISTGMVDEDGRKLAKEYRYAFQTSAEDRVREDLSAWKVTAPRVGTTNPVRIRMPQPIDHRSLQRFLHVKDGNGKKITGTTEVEKGQTGCLFRPVKAWQTGTYKVIIREDLEDLAGNTPLRPFDLDLSAEQPAPQPLFLSFRPVK